MGDQANKLRELMNQQVATPALDGTPSTGPLAGPGARVIVVTSGKGGVGKTNVTVN